MSTKRNKLFTGMNRIITLLTLSDVFTWGFYTIIASLAGIYLAEKLDENVVEMVGWGTSIYLISRALIQIPTGWIHDKLKGDHDEALTMVIGNLLMGLPYIFYPMLPNYTVYLILQAIFGIGAGINVISWRKLFAKNLDKGQEGKSYGTYDAILNIVTAAFCAIGGYISNLGMNYFTAVIFSVGIVMMSSAFIPVIILNQKSFH